MNCRDNLECVEKALLDLRENMIPIVAIFYKSISRETALL